MAEGEYPWRVWGREEIGDWKFLSAHTSRVRALNKAQLVTATPEYLSHPIVQAKIEFDGFLGDDPRTYAEARADAAIMRRGFVPGLY